ncbi:MAG: hypothetical protein AUI48_03705 [Chloroflexi bacterium 13_1_40CM_2_68_14]|nr:MAG: hypothetical protein AUI48_03705 [Chloroflexi bacterium 13_1_40CM_2_68_14]
MIGGRAVVDTGAPGSARTAAAADSLAAGTAGAAGGGAGAGAGSTGSGSKGTGFRSSFRPSSVAASTVVRSDVNGWSVAAPRPLQLFLEEEGRVLGGPELLVRGRSQADAHGLIVPLPQRSVAVLSNGSLALRIRRVRGAARVGGEQTDWKGVIVASIAAILMVTGMRFWSATVPPPKVSAGDPELIKPRPLVVRASPPKPDNAPVLDAQKVRNQARRDPGKAVARHQGQEGEAGGKTAPRRDARAQRKMDDRALIAEIGLLKALGGGNGKSDVFGVALEKGTRDAMGHLTGPRIGWPFRYRGAAVVVRSTAPIAPVSITACVGAMPGDSSTRSAAALPRRIRSARNARELLSFPPS